MSSKYYVKLIKDSKGEITAYSLSSDRNRVELFDGVKVKQKDGEKGSILSGKKSSFFDLNAEIFENFISFYDAVPTYLGISKFFPQFILNNKLHSYIKEHGYIISNSRENEFYEIDREDFNVVSKQIEQMRSFSNISAYFPGFYIVGLISLYDYFIENLAKLVIEMKPEIIFGSERSFSFKDLIEHSTVESMRSHIVSEEIEALLRKSHDEQLKWFGSKLGMKIEPRKELYADFIELCERRNLLTHNGGRVTEQYLKKCKDAGYDTSRKVLGEKLGVTPKYFRGAVEVVIEVAAQLVHVIWHKLDGDNAEEASRALINITYNLISDEKYQLAIRLITFIIENKSTKMDDVTRKTHIVNCANARKLSGDENFDEILNGEDWTSSDIKFRVCVAAVKGDVAEVNSLIEPAIKSNSLSVDDIREWPIFKFIREDVTFRNKFKEIFGYSLVSKVEEEIVDAEKPAVH